MKEVIYNQVTKTVYGVSKIEDITPFRKKRIILSPEEAKLCVDKGILVYREEFSRPNGETKSVFCCYVELEKLIKILK